jgi:enamine deaminase RidA (YjgF/YER057c/UK114 family)
MPFTEVRSSKIFPSPAPLSIATITQSARLLHISGQVSQDVNGNTVGPGDIEKQTAQVIENINTLVNEQGGTLADICKITIFLTSRDHLPTVMEVRRRYFKQPYPATSAVIVAGLANAEWMIEIEALAALK